MSPTANDWRENRKGGGEVPVVERPTSQPKKSSSKKKNTPKEGLLVDLDSKSDWNQDWGDDEAWDALNKSDK